MESHVQAVLTLSMASMMFYEGVVAVAPMLVQLADAQSGYGKAPASAPGASSFVAPRPGLPTAVFSSYYPSPTDQEPQPAVYDPVLNITCVLDQAILQLPHTDTSQILPI